MANTRLSVIYAALLTGETHTAEGLADLTGTSARTVRRDIDRLQAAGLAVEGEPSQGYRVTDPAGWPLFATDGELRALAAGLRAAAASGDPAIVPGAKSLLAKARGLVPSRSRSKYGL